MTEYSVSELMKKGAKKYELEYEEINTSFIQDEELVKLGFNQIDLELKINGKHVSIEIRSSFSYKTSVGRLFGYPLINGKGAFSIIGWYTSSSKPKEIKKDYYIFGIHQYYPSKIREMLNSTVEVIIASAVSKNTLETEGYDSTLKQNGAKFRVINPIKNSTPPLDGIKEILGLR